MHGDALQLVALYTWALAILMVGLVWLIARFFAKTSGRQLPHRLFAAPMLLFGAGTLRQLTTEQIVGDPLGGLLWFLGAAVQIVLCLMLYRQMTQD